MIAKYLLLITKYLSVVPGRNPPLMNVVRPPRLQVDG